ncbi:MAG: thermonuclease family protein [Bacilli bacterium]|nr:thermonuclease family protein [Bacilli bacterium]
MKKYLLFFITFFSSLCVVYADERIDVSLVKCVDGDTAVFKVAGEEIKFRFLAVDTPETVHPTKGEEEGGKEASTYTCEKLTNAKKLQILYDEKSTKIDKYGRGLAWIYVDDVLLQEELIKLGYAEVAYIYGKYAFVDHLCEVQSKAIEEKVGIWSGNREEGYCKTKSNKTTKAVDEEEATSERRTKNTKVSSKSNKKEDDIIVILEDMIDETTCIPILIVLCAVLVVVKATKKSKKKS